MTDDDIRRFLNTDYERAVRVVTAVCGDQARAEDAVQDSLVDLWEHRRDIDDAARWVTAVAINRARSRWRSGAAERRAFERLASRQPTATSDDPVSLDARLVEALQSLSPAQRQVAALHYLMDMSVAEVGRCLGLADGTVKTHLHRGRAALRSALEVAASQEDESHARS